MHPAARIALFILASLVITALITVALVVAIHNWSTTCYPPSMCPGHLHNPGPALGPPRA